MSSAELIKLPPPLYRRVSAYNSPIVTWLEDVSQGLILGFGSLLCRYTAFSQETSILMTRVLLSSFPQMNIFFFFPNFALLLCLESSHGHFDTGGHSATGGGQLAKGGQSDSLWGRSLVLGHPWWPCTHTRNCRETRKTKTWFSYWKHSLQCWGQGNTGWGMRCGYLAIQHCVWWPGQWFRLSHVRSQGRNPPESLQ